MPIYEYSCGQCGKTTDVLQKVDAPAPERCEHCGAEGKLSRLVSRSSFVLKGGGWYSDLYSSTKSAPSGGGAASTSSTSATPAAPSSGTSSTTSTSPAPASGGSSGSSGSSGSGSGSGSTP